MPIPSPQGEPSGNNEDVAQRMYTVFKQQIAIKNAYKHFMAGSEKY